MIAVGRNEILSAALVQPNVSQVSHSDSVATPGASSGAEALSGALRVAWRLRMEKNAKAKGKSDDWESLSYRAKVRCRPDKSELSSWYAEGQKRSSYQRVPSSSVSPPGSSLSTNYPRRENR